MRAKGCWVLVTVTLAMGVAGLAHPAEERRTDHPPSSRTGAGAADTVGRNLQ